jgi:hypothetical protein
MRPIFYIVLASLVLALAPAPAAGGIGDYLRFYKHDYYGTLGVPSDAAAGDIKRAYRDLSRKWHPDKNTDEGAEARFREIAEAYEQLKTAAAREEYDDFIANLPRMMRPGVDGRTDVRWVLAGVLAMLGIAHWLSLRSRHTAVLARCRRSARFSRILAELTAARDAANDADQDAPEPAAGRCVGRRILDVFFYVFFFFFLHQPVQKKKKKKKKLD